MKIIKKIATAICFSFLGLAANANLVTNGDFETGTFAGWTKSGNPSLSDVIANTVTTNHTFLWRSGATGSQAFISQMLTTTAGNHYTLSFDLFSGGATNSLFDAFFDSVSVYSLSNTVIGWTHFEFTDLVATGASTELKFGARNDPSFTRLDNISVLSTSQSVPEPESLALFAAGAFALVVARRRHVK